MGKVIIAASGIGKTHFVKRSLNWIDFDVYVFDSFIRQNTSCKWLQDYIMWYGYNIITNSHFLGHLCVKNSIKVDFVIIPSFEMKDEIIQRIKERDGLKANWWKEYEKNWKAKLQNYINLPFPKIYLKPGQYVSDVIDAEGNPKEGVEIVY